MPTKTAAFPELMKRCTLWPKDMGAATSSSRSEAHGALVGGSERTFVSGALEMIRRSPLSSSSATSLRERTKGSLLEPLLPLLSMNAVSETSFDCSSKHFAFVSGGDGFVVVVVVVAPLLEALRTLGATLGSKPALSKAATASSPSFCAFRVASSPYKIK